MATKRGLDAPEDGPQAKKPHLNDTNQEVSLLIIGPLLPARPECDRL